MHNASAVSAAGAAQVTGAMLWTALAICAGSVSAMAEAASAIAMHGTPAMNGDFTVLPYAEPEAPQGGRLVQGVLGTFDSLNPLIVKGVAALGMRGYVIESLMARSYDEPFTLYGLWRAPSKPTTRAATSPSR